MAEVKRGYRKVTTVIPVAVYELLKAQADDNDREVGQQAAFLLRRVLVREATAEPKEAVDYTVPLGANGAVPVELPSEAGAEVE
jgi:hypothetical protein